MPVDESYEIADNKTDKVPMATCVVNLVNKHALTKPLLVLFDSGSNSSWIKAKSLPKGVVPTKVDEISSSTLAGSMKSNQQVTLERLVFPEFFKTRVVDSLEARVFHTTCRYDVIVGRDFLTAIGLKLDFKDQKLCCKFLGIQIPVGPHSQEQEFGIPMSEFRNSGRTYVPYVLFC